MGLRLNLTPVLFVSALLWSFSLFFTPEAFPGDERELARITVPTESDSEKLEIVAYSYKDAEGQLKFQIKKFLNGAPILIEPLPMGLPTTFSGMELILENSGKELVLISELVAGEKKVKEEISRINVEDLKKISDPNTRHATKMIREFGWMMGISPDGKVAEFLDKEGVLLKRLYIREDQSFFTGAEYRIKEGYHLWEVDIAPFEQGKNIHYINVIAATGESIPALRCDVIVRVATPKEALPGDVDGLELPGPRNRPTHIIEVHSGP